MPLMVIKIHEMSIKSSVCVIKIDKKCLVLIAYTTRCKEGNNKVPLCMLAPSEKGLIT